MITVRLGRSRRAFRTLPRPWVGLVAHAEDYRVEYNTVRPHEALAWNRPRDVHLGLADPLIPNFPETEDLPAA